MDVLIKKKRPPSLDAIKLESVFSLRLGGSELIKTNDQVEFLSKGSFEFLEIKRVPLYLMNQLRILLNYTKIMYAIIYCIFI